MNPTKKELRGLKQYVLGTSDAKEAQIELVEAGQLDARLLALTDEQKRQYISLLWMKIRDRAVRDFYFFSKYIYGNRDLTTMHSELCSFATLDAKRKLILEPRGSLKSSVYTESYALWRLVRNPNLRILIDNEEHSRAKTFLKAIRDCIQHNPNFRRCFGALDRNRYKDIWTETRFNVATRTRRTKEANLECMGVDSTKTGMHYDLIIADDLVSDKNTRTDAQIKKVIEHYRLLLSLLDPGCEMTVIGTRWHFADLYGYLLDRDKDRVKKGKKPRWKKLIRAARDTKGQLLWPERLSEEFLAEQREEQGVYMFSCNYLNDPTGGEDAIFRLEWLRFHTELPQTPLECSIVLDPALGKPGSEQRKSDFSAITTQFRDYENHRYIHRVMRGRWNPTAALQNLVYARQWVIDRYGIFPRVGIETVAFQWVLAHNLHEMQRAGKVPKFRVHELARTTPTTKHLQIERLVPLFEQGLFHLRGKSVENCSPGAKLLIAEYLQFPQGKYDDIMDTLAYHEELAKIPKMPHREREEDTVLQRLKRDAVRRGRQRKGLLSVGSRITGTKRGWQSSTSTGASVTTR